jgi:hypothetical protein
MLKNTYSPLATMLSSSAASIISRTVLGLAHTTTTARKEPPHQQSILHVETTYKASVHEMLRPIYTVVASVPNIHEYKFQLVPATERNLTPIKNLNFLVVLAS